MTQSLIAASSILPLAANAGNREVGGKHRAQPPHRARHHVAHSGRLSNTPKGGEICRYTCRYSRAAATCEAARMTAPAILRARAQLLQMQRDREALRQAGIATTKLDRLIQAKERTLELLLDLEADVAGEAKARGNTVADAAVSAAKRSGP